MKKILSIDAETDGLWGNPFAIGAIVYEDGLEIDKFVGRLPESFVKNEWVKENVLTAIKNSIPSSYLEYEVLLKDFARFYLKHKEGAEVVVHMGYIVEAYLFRELHRLGLIGDWDAPFPLYDVSGNLQAAGEIPTSVEAYVNKYDIKTNGYGTTHNPLYDAEVAARAYMHLMKYI